MEGINEQKNVWHSCTRIYRSELGPQQLATQKFAPCRAAGWLNELEREL